MNQPYWVKSVFLYRDYVFGESSLLVVKLSSLTTFALLTLIFGGIIWFLARPFLALALLISAIIISVEASRKRRQLSLISFDDLSKAKSVEQVPYDQIVNLEIRGRILTISTSRSTYKNLVESSDICSLKRIVLNGNKASVVRTKSNWRSAAVGIVIVILALFLILVNPVLFSLRFASLAMMAIEYILECTGIGLIIYAVIANFLSKSVQGSKS